MVRLDLGEVVLRRMQEKDIEAVKALIKVRFNIISLMGCYFFLTRSLFILFICPFSQFIFHLRPHAIFSDKNLFIFSNI